MMDIFSSYLMFAQLEIHTPFGYASGSQLLSGQKDLELSGVVSKDCIDFMTMKIKEIESVVKEKNKSEQSFVRFRTIPGVELILAMTIMLETGTINRFTGVGNYSSYCRKVPSKWISNNKKKGNRYLAWAFSEAAEMCRRYNDSAKAFFNRKTSQDKPYGCSCLIGPQIGEGILLYNER